MRIVNQRRRAVRKSLGLLVVLASAGLATDAVSQPATRQPLPAGLQRGPDAFVMLTGGKGNVSPQRTGTAVVVKPYRPTVGPVRPGSGGTSTGSGKGGKPEVRDHRDAAVKPYRPTVDNPGPVRPGSGGMSTGSGKGGMPEVRDHRHK